MYEALGIDADILAFGEEILDSLKDRFEQIDKNAEYNYFLSVLLNFLFVHLPLLI